MNKRGAILALLVAAGLLAGCGGNFYGGGDVGRKTDLTLSARPVIAASTPLTGSNSSG